jgi:hypothetical protein
LNPERRRELAEKIAAQMWKTIAHDTFVLESAFLELEREVREECAKVCDENANLNRMSHDYGAGNEKALIAWCFVDRAEYLAAAIRAGKE